MQTAIKFEQKRLPPETEELRADVRAFLADEISRGTFSPALGLKQDSFDREFSKRVGAKGWIGMTWPKQFGGREMTHLDRYIVTEEMRTVTAPTWCHFVADRQSGPVIIKYGTDEMKEEILPAITRGELCFAIGMSEPNSGSDLFAASVKAELEGDQYRVNGRKIWTSNAHRADYMIALLRTSPPTKENRRHGLTQFLVKMDTPGVSINPISAMPGMSDFNEVLFEDVMIPADHVLGEVDGAWKQATAELAYERSGPERFLETFYVLTALTKELGEQPDARGAEGLGRLVAQLHTLRRMSVSVAGMLHEGKEPVLESSIVKDLGTVWEQALPAQARTLGAFAKPDPSNEQDFDDLIEFASLCAPKFTIQGGTTEILRGIIARGLGMR
ncbi:MAG: acyl-CoA dehydrogenase family protein [Pseudomonadota bacterium]